MITTRAKARKGETALVVGAGGGVSSAAIQILRHLGCKVIATTGTSEKMEKAKRIGANAVINYRTEDVAARVKELTRGRGVDIVVENVGGASWPSSAASLAKGGRIVTCGRTSRQDVTFNLADFYWYQHTDRGSTMGGPREFKAVSSLVFRGKVKPAIDRVELLSAENVRRGHEALEKGEQFGKIVFRV